MALDNRCLIAKLLAHKITYLSARKIKMALKKSNSHGLIIFKRHCPNICPFRKNRTNQKAEISATLQSISAFLPVAGFRVLQKIISCPPAFWRFVKKLSKNLSGINSAKKRFA